MRAIIPAERMVSSKQKKRIKELVTKEHERHKHETTRKIMKMFCVILNDKFGFGKARLYKVICEVLEMTNEHADDEIFWARMDRKLHQIGMDFQDEEWEL